MIKMPTEALCRDRRAASCHKIRSDDGPAEDLPTQMRATKAATDLNTAEAAAEVGAAEAAAEVSAAKSTTADMRFSGFRLAALCLPLRGVCRPP